MSIEKADTVDFIGVEKKSGQIALAISDHLDWNDEKAHLLKLQDKINTYLSFIESGEVYDAYPQAIDKSFVIKVYGKYALTDAAKRFYRKAGATLRKAGFGLRFIGRKRSGEAT